MSKRKKSPNKTEGQKIKSKSDRLNKKDLDKILDAVDMDGTINEDVEEAEDVVDEPKGESKKEEKKDLGQEHDHVSDAGYHAVNHQAV